VATVGSSDSAGGSPALRDGERIGRRPVLSLALGSSAVRRWARRQLTGHAPCWPRFFLDLSASAWDAGSAPTGVRAARPRHVRQESSIQSHGTPRTPRRRPGAGQGDGSAEQERRGCGAIQPARQELRTTDSQRQNLAPAPGPWSRAGRRPSTRAERPNLRHPTPGRGRRVDFPSEGFRRSTYETRPRRPLLRSGPGR
jgi:hypothetical protein